MVQSKEKRTVDNISLDQMLVNLSYSLHFCQVSSIFVVITESQMWCYDTFDSIFLRNMQKLVNLSSFTLALDISGKNINRKINSVKETKKKENIL